MAWHQHPKLWDWVSVGMFAPWKRHERLIDQKGDRLVKTRALSHQKFRNPLALTLKPRP